MPSINQINAFVAVYELNSYSAAARLLNKGRTTVRELILTLEEQMHVALFVVDKKQVIATEKARGLYFHAKLLQSQLVLFDEMTSSLLLDQEDQIILCYDAMLPVQFVSALSVLLQQKFPGLNLIWKAERWSQAMKLVAENINYIAFYPLKVKPFANIKIEGSVLGVVKLGLYAGKNSPLSLNKSINRLQLRSHRQVLTHSFLEAGVNDYLRYSARYLAVESNADICKLLESLDEDAWSLLPETHALEYVDEGRLVQLKADFLWNDLHLNFIAYNNKSARRSPTIKYLLSVLPQLAKAYF